MGSGPSLALTVCPLTGVPYVEPVKAPDGFTYSRRAIEAWITSWKATDGKVLSPLTSEPMEITDNMAFEKDEDARNAVLTAFSGSMFLGKSPQAATARTLEGQVASVYDLNRCFAVCDSLRDLLARVLDSWEPPKLVVIGEESSGKSTLLERLLMMSLFPRAEGVCTRARIHLKLRHTASSSIPRLSVVEAKSKKIVGGPWMISAETGHQKVLTEMQRIVIEDNGTNTSVCASRILVLEIEGPHLPSIDLVDLPGLVQAPREAAEATRALVESQIQEYRKYSIFLAILPAGRRPTSSTAIRVVEDFDLQSNTLGVFTHCDELPESKKDQLRRWLERPDEYGFNDCHYPLAPYGWVATCNAPLPKQKYLPMAAADQLLRGKQQISHGNLLRLQQQAQHEMNFFRSQGMEDLLEMGLVGTGALQTQLHAMFSKYLLKRWAPLTLFRLRRERERIRCCLAGLGWPAANGILFGQTLDEMHAKAVVAATEALRDDVPVISHALAQKAWLPLRESIASLIGRETACFLEDLQDVVTSKEDQVHDACKAAADKVPPCFLACVRAAMTRDPKMPDWPSIEALNMTSTPPFVLSRFPPFIDVVVKRMTELLADWRKDLAAKLYSCVHQLFQETSPWVKARARLQARPPSFYISFACNDIVGAILTVFMQQSPSVLCEKVIAELKTLIAPVSQWIEPRAKERETILQQISDIDRATRELKDLLGGQDVVPEGLAELEQVSLARCTCTGVGISHAWINLPSKFTITAMDHAGKPFNLPPDHEFEVSVRPADAKADVIMKVQVANTGYGIYTGEYKMTEEAMNSKDTATMTLVVELHGNAVAGSPFKLSVSPEPLWRCSMTLGSMGTDDGQFSSPSGLAVDADHVYVVDMEQQRIQIFGSSESDQPGKFIRALGPADGAADGKLETPWGLAVDRSDVYVVDSASCCVKMYSKDDGSFLQMFGSAGSGNGELNAPRGLLLDGDYVYVADSGNHRVQVFSKKGPGCFVPCNTIGAKGDRAGQFEGPCSIAADGEQLFVVDTGNHRIQEFCKKDCSHVRSFGDTQLDHPLGIAVGGSYVYVSDSSYHRICVFDKSDGSYIRTVGARGSEKGEFREPGCIVVNGIDFYVSEKGNHRVQVFR